MISWSDGSPFRWGHQTVWRAKLFWTINLVHARIFGSHDKHFFVVVDDVEYSNEGNFKLIRPTTLKQATGCCRFPVYTEGKTIATSKLAAHKDDSICRETPARKTRSEFAKWTSQRAKSYQSGLSHGPMCAKRQNTKEKKMLRKRSAASQIFKKKKNFLSLKYVNFRLRFYPLLLLSFASLCCFVFFLSLVVVSTLLCLVGGRYAHLKWSQTKETGVLNDVKRES